MTAFNVGDAIYLGITPEYIGTTSFITGTYNITVRITSVMNGTTGWSGNAPMYYAPVKPKIKIEKNKPFYRTLNPKKKAW